MTLTGATSPGVRGTISAVGRGVPVYAPKPSTGKPQRTVRCAYTALVTLSRNTAIFVAKSEHNTFHRFGFVVAVAQLGLFLSVVRFGEFTMSIFAYRKHLRFLTPFQRRRWWDQKKRLTPRVRISGAYVPPSVTREFTYVKVG
ncbi:hypothetical protein [Paraburkholderia acidiphila]|uniref:Uncharacterized protein n=2 Tax=Paraburkholderia TaxID=1822464 RepID=A0A7Z2G563_9BURK|nr:hypothetical protein [Paraburkholderia acidiphila]QGZ55365.1 hypothetical protein FAZ97_10835 [Paraburkholderia acidiphila]